MKKTLSILLAMVLLLTCIPLGAVSVSAATYGDLTYVVSGGEVTITDCDDSASGKLTIPKTIEGYPVTAIGNEAFLWCESLISVTIPDSVIDIGDYAFRYCVNMTTVTIGDGVTDIGEYAFGSCVSLTSMTIGDSVTSIGDYAFYFCISLTTVTIPDNVVSVGEWAFCFCESLDTVIIGDGVTTIGDSAFNSCKGLNVVTIGDSVTSIGAGAFFDCTSLTTVTIPNSVTSIGEFAFTFCDSLTTVTIPDGVTSIGVSTFDFCSSLTSVTIGNSVTAIGAYAFRDCYSLTKVTIPDSATTIGDNAFSGCIELALVYYAGTKTDRQKISINSGNEYLTDTTWHYNYTPLAIVKQPTTGYAKMGEKVKVTVKAEGDGLTYVWRVKNAGSSKYSASSVTSNTYSVTMSEKTKDRLVFCYVYDKYGNQVKSETVRLREAVSITTQPENVKVAKGEKAKVTVKASGDGLTYTWYVKSDGATKYTKSSVTKSTYSVTMTDKVHMRLVYCVVTDKYGKKVKTEKVRLRMK